MTRSCALGCNNSGSLKFLEELQKKWVAAICREDFQVKHNMSLCKYHFLPRDFRTQWVDTCKLPKSDDTNLLCMKDEGYSDEEEDSLPPAQRTAKTGTRKQLRVNKEGSPTTYGKPNAPSSSAIVGERTTRGLFCFNEKEEQDFVGHIKTLSKLFHGCVGLDIRRRAYQFAVLKRIPHTFDTNKRMAGPEWLKEFMLRHPSIQVEEVSSISFSETNISDFYDRLQSFRKQYKLGASRIFTMDEIILQTQQRSYKTIFTVFCCARADGQFLSPMFIYPRELEITCPMTCETFGAIHKFSDNGRTNEALFLAWLKHFSSLANPTPSDPVLLVLDNHFTHSTMESYFFCKERGIIMLPLPPDTSHWLQPLERGFFSSIMETFRQKEDSQIENNLAILFKDALDDISAEKLILNAFQESGICF